MVESKNGFVYDQNPYSYHETDDYFNQPPQHQMKTYSCDYCGGSPHPGFDCQTGNTPVYDQGPCYNHDFRYDQPLFYSPSQQQQFNCCEVCGGPHYSSDCQTRNSLVYEPTPGNNYDFSCFDPPPQYPIVYPPLHEMSLQELISYMPPLIAKIANHQMQRIDEMKSTLDSMRRDLVTYISKHLVNSIFYKERDDNIEPTDTLLMGDEVISIILAKEIKEFIKFSVDDLVPIPMESEVISDSNSECDMPIPFPTTDVRKEDFDINSLLGEQAVDFLMENEDVACLPRHLVKRLFSHLVKNPCSTKRMSDEPLGDDSKPRSYDVTFSNPLFDFNDNYTLCYDNLLFDKEFEDISSLDPPKSATLNYKLLSNPDSVSRSLETSELNLEELSTEIGLDDSIPTEIDDGYYDS
nr:hypothetical protein [Tanacetum cinerariifolium]GEW84885.1 hypothetical protein [Tanacetum cinerariifolium]